MTHEEYQNSIEKIASHYGYESQSRQLIEEMAELTVAINKAWRKSLMCGFITLDNLKEEAERNLPFDSNFLQEKEFQDVIEEIADVEIMLEQIKYLMSCQSEVEQEKARKIERQLQRMESE